MIAQISFRPATLDEMADLASDGAHHLQQFVIALQNRASEELQDADHLAFHLHRKGKATVQSRRGSGPAAREISIEGNVIDPRRFARLPHTAGKTYPPGTPQLPRPNLKFPGIDDIAIPKVSAAKDIVMFENRPDCARVPI